MQVQTRLNLAVPQKVLALLHSNVPKALAASKVPKARKYRRFNQACLLAGVFWCSTVAFGLTTNQEIQQLYIAYLGRPADAAGLFYWQEELDSGALTLEQLRTNLVNEQPEYLANYGQLSTSDLVGSVYGNLFNRSADSDGQEYWIQQLNSGALLPDQLMLAFINGASVPDQVVILNKVFVAECHTNGEQTYTEEHLEQILSSQTSVAITECPLGSESPSDYAFATAESTARFLTQATFGPSSKAISGLTGTSASEWFRKQLSVPASNVFPALDEYSGYSNDEEEFDFIRTQATTFGFWKNVIAGEDQLRQRMAFALSQILVVSNGGGEILTDVPEAVAYYQDLLIDNAFGNYRDVLDLVTYSPAMGYYLTYLGSEKGNPDTGRMPDENYARELLQLFTIGLVELNADGTARLDDSGSTIETYTNEDVTGLARVFTGLNIEAEDEEEFEEEAGELLSRPMIINSGAHSEREKTFLGLTIPANTDARTSIAMALDHIFAHPNVGPFIGTQIIQRLVTSNPSAAYVGRVSTAFDTGSYRLPDGQQAGTGERGDLSAVLAAVLFDPEARGQASETFGKIREPILRFSHWARAFNVTNVTPEHSHLLWDTSEPTSLSQHPYRAPSVFNFFRPGYVAPGSLTGEKGLKAPELQIVNAGTVPSYTNFMLYFTFAEGQHIDPEELQEEYDAEGLLFDPYDAPESFLPDYSEELDMADDTEILLDHLDLLLTYGNLSQETRREIQAALEEVPAEEEEERFNRVALAVLLVMTSPDYLVQL